MYIYIQLPCGPSPPPCLLRSLFFVLCSLFFVLCSLFFVPQGSKKTNPQSNNNYQKRHPKLSGDHEKVTPGGLPEALGGGLGTILVPRGARTRKRAENGLEDPPQGPSWETHFDFLSILFVFSCCFFECRFGRVSGSNFKWIWVGFLREFRICFNAFLMSSESCEMSFYTVIYSSLGMSASGKYERKSLESEKFVKVFSRGLWEYI